MLSRTARTGLGALAALALAVGGSVAAAAPADAAGALKLQVMTFNTCANTKPESTKDNPNARCVNGRQTGKVAADLAHRITVLHPGTTVVLLEEVCYADVVALRTKLGSSWQLRFTGIKDEGSGSKPSGTVAPRACVKDKDTHKSRGNFGIAVGVKASATFAVHYYPDAHVPKAKDAWGHWNVHQAAICATVSSWGARVCGTHLTPGTAPVFRAAHAGEVSDLISYGGSGARVVLGGDLNATPTSANLTPLYDTYTECDQVNHDGARAGTATFQKPDGTRSGKIDYIFATRNTTNSCYVTTAHVLASDHVPVFDTITFPAS